MSSMRFSSDRHRWLSGFAVVAAVLACLVMVAADASAQYTPRTKPRQAGTQQTPASIAITDPAGAATWQPGTQQTIKWTATGVRGSVKITLVAADNSEQVIIRSTPNNGTYQYRVPVTLKEGAFRIVVSSIDGSVTGQSVGMVTVQKKTMGQVAQQMGQAGAQQAGQTVGQMGQAANQATQSGMQQAGSQSAAGQQSVAGGVQAGTAATADVETATPAQSGAVSAGGATAQQQTGGMQSGMQAAQGQQGQTQQAQQGTGQGSGWAGAVAGAAQQTGSAQAPSGQLADGYTGPGPYSISLDEPNGGETWLTGEPQTISWQKLNVNNAKISIVPDDGSEFVIVEQTGNVDSVEFTPQPRFRTGNNKFRVKVATLDNAVSSTSQEPFSIWSGVPVDLMCEMRNFGEGFVHHENGFRLDTRARFVEFEIFVMNKGTQYLPAVPVVVRVTKQPDNVQIERFEAGFSNVDPRVWVRTNEPIRFAFETWKGKHHQVQWDSGTYVFEVEVDYQNTLNEPEAYRLDNKVTMTFQVQ